jgi:cytidylate kinase
MIIAIDGPSAAGKSTIAKLLAQDLGIEYIDTGAMYRAVALKVCRDGVDPLNEEALAALLDNTGVDLAGPQVLLDGEDVSGLIRTGGISMQASRISAIPIVRQKLVALQREIGSRKSVVMDGRDIGSNVFQNAEYKFFITASPGIRAERRRKELIEKGENASFEDVLADIEKRDWDDSHRPLNPLVQTEDAVLIATDDFSIEEVLENVKNYLQ